MPAKIGAVSNAGHGKLRFIEKLRRSRCLQRQVELLRFLRPKHTGAEGGLAESLRLHAQHIDAFAKP